MVFPTVIGQWIFVYYLATHYGVSAIQGNWAEKSKGDPQGIITGDLIRTPWLCIFY